MIRGLTEETHGNASGIGLAEFCTRRVIEQVDVEKTRINCLTAGHISAAMMPLDYPTDRATIEAALKTIGMVGPESAGIVWIRNTLELAEVACSSAYLEEARRRPDLEVISEPRAWPFDPAGNLPATGVHGL